MTDLARLTQEPDETTHTHHRPRRDRPTGGGSARIRVVRHTESGAFMPDNDASDLSLDQHLRAALDDLARHDLDYGNAEHNLTAVVDHLVAALDIFKRGTLINNPRNHSIDRHRLTYNRDSNDGTTALFVCVHDGYEHVINGDRCDIG